MKIFYLISINCNTYNNTIIISIKKILKYYNIFIWKIDYSPLRKLTVQINKVFEV